MAGVHEIVFRTIEWKNIINDDDEM